MSTTAILQRTLVGLGIIVALGILVHDTKFDKALKLALPVATATAALSVSSHALDFAGNAHTHVERASLQHAFSGIPRTQAREDRKYNLDRYFGRNSYFGGSGVVWPHV